MTVPVVGEWRGLEPPVVVGVSGGADSTALLALAVDASLDPIAVHVDHGIRPGGDLEAASVAEVATRLGARFRRERVHVGDGPNLESRAREARYRALEAARVELGATAILVGHTADDQAETVVLNLLRGSGRAGLGGMATRRGAVARPLLGVRRSVLTDLCRARRLPVLHDPSNDELRFRRNWVRHEVLPVLSEGANRDLVPLLARQAELLRDESELLDELACTLLASAGGDRPIGRELAAAHPALARRAVRVWLGTPPPSAAEVERVLAVARGERVACELAGGRCVRRSGGRLQQTVRSGAAEARAADDERAGVPE
jgi:tRNA(Ile)-lysidine synthase